MGETTVPTSTGSPDFFHQQYQPPGPMDWHVISEFSPITKMLAKQFSPGKLSSLRTIDISASVLTYDGLHIHILSFTWFPYTHTRASTWIQPPPQDSSHYQEKRAFFSRESQAKPSHLPLECWGPGGGRSNLQQDKKLARQDTLCRFNKTRYSWNSPPFSALI